MPSHEFRHKRSVALLIGVAGWLVPGAGHLLLGLWSRAAAVAVTVGALAWLGVAAHGRLFSLSTADFFDLLGFFADCGAGLFFYLAQKWSNGGADVAHAAGDYGTRFFAAAGVLNVLAAVDAYRIARGEEQENEGEDGAEPEGVLVPVAPVSEGGADAASQLHLKADAVEEASASRHGARIDEKDGVQIGWLRGEVTYYITLFALNTGSIPKNTLNQRSGPR